MNASKKLIAGGLIAGGLMLGGAGLVVGAGIAKGDTTSDPCNAACHKSWDDWDRATPDERKHMLCRVVGNMPLYRDDCLGYR
jgi:hypothetical protein